MKHCYQNKFGIRETLNLSAVADSSTHAKQLKMVENIGIFLKTDENGGKWLKMVENGGNIENLWKQSKALENSKKKHSQNGQDRWK